MKTPIIRLLLFLLNLCICEQLASQTFSSQADVNALDPTITDLTGYVTIEGNDIANLDAFSNVESISGTLIIRNNGSLTNLDGFSNVNSIQGSITIENNIALETIDSLFINVTSVLRDLRIINNEVLTDIDGFINITEFNGRVYIERNPMLTNIDGLANVTAINRDLRIDRNGSLSDIDGLANVTTIEATLDISNNPLITNINSLNKITSLNGTLSLIGNENLLDLNGLLSLTTIDGTLNVSNNSMLTQINGLSNLNSIIGRVSFVGNANLINIEGLSQLTNIDGFLMLDDIGITTVESLSNLTSIDGSLIIRNNKSLLNIDGLSKVTSLTGSLQIAVNDALINIDGLNSLITLEGAVDISKNSMLLNISGLSNLVSIPGNLEIDENGMLTDIKGLENLISVEGRLLIQRNALLANIDGLLKLTTIAGIVWVSANETLGDINGLSNITSITGILNINNNDALSEIGALSNITSLEGELNITYNQNLENLDGLANVNSVSGSLTIEKNDALVDLQGLENLSALSGSIIIENNNSLTNLDGLDNLSSVTGSLKIQHNTSLLNIDALRSIESVEGELEIRDNDVLTEIDGLDNISSILGTLRILYNGGLTDVGGLSGLTTIDGILEISFNNVLTNIDGLSGITAIAGQLEILNNGALINIDGLSNLESLEGNLQLRSNNSLESIESLSNLESFTGNITIRFNRLLSKCCSLIPIIESDEHGELTIGPNAVGCQSVNEILETVCGLSVNYITNPPCQGANNGSIDLTVGNYESLPLSYSWEMQNSSITGNGESEEDEFSIVGLSAGSYSITVTAGSFEKIVEDIALDVSAGSSLDILEVTSENATFSLNNGSISVTYAGGDAPYSISLTGPTIRNSENISDLDQTLTALLPGEYTLFLYDANGQTASIDITLIDESVDVKECAEPMDIIILSLVSSAISAEEYKQSKSYFEEFYQSINLGLGSEDSRVAIAEWSGRDQSEIKIDITGDDFLLSDYHNLERSFTGNTDILSALQFGSAYLEANARPSAQKVIIFTFDGCAAFSAAAYAEELKESGIIIADIGIGIVNSSSKYRRLLKEAASKPDMAYFGNDFLQLDPLKLSIVLTYSSCSGTTSNVNFNRDGTIEIDGYTAPGCPFPDHVDVTFTVSSLEQLSIPTGTPVSFYHNDPSNYGSSLISTFIIPCSVPAGGSQTFTTTIPVETATHLYAVLNDSGVTDPAFDLPVTDIIESRYNNNMDNEKICVDEYATLQALKSSVALHPICEDIVQYTVSVCNISEIDAQGVTIQDMAPAEFMLTETSVNLNGCSTQHQDNFDIPANCCLSLTLSYDVSNAPDGIYADQDVMLSGPEGQTYIDFDGAVTADEDVLLDGVEECGNPTVSFSKEGDYSTTCPDHSMTYIYYIDNKSSTPLYNLQFTDELPLPIEWVYKPYNMQGLSIASSESVSGQLATFTIDQVDAQTVASFQIDVYIGDTETEVVAKSVATLTGFPSYINGGEEILESNETTTTVLAEISIEVMDTILLAPTEFAVDLDALIPGTTNVEWSTTGDGEFSDPTIKNPNYVLGEEDKLDSLIGLFITVNTYCGEKGVSILLKRECDLSFDRMRPIDLCNDEMQTAQLTWSGGTGPYQIEEIDVDLGMNTTHDLQEISAGVYSYIIEDARGCRSQVDLEINDAISAALKIDTTCTSQDLYEVNINGDGIELSSEDNIEISNVAQGQYKIIDIPVADTLKIFATDNISGCSKELIIASPACGTCLVTVLAVQTQELTCLEDALLDASGSSQGENISIVWLDENNDTLSTDYVFSTDKGGEYTVEISDLAGGCSAKETIVVSDSRELPSADILINDALCAGEDSGGLEISNVVSSSTDLLVFLDDVLLTEDMVSDLSAGEYLLAIEDVDGCTFDTLLIINEPLPIVLDSPQNQIIVNQGESLNIELNTNLSPQNIDSILWDPSISCDNCLEYLVEDIQNNLNFEVTIIDNNGCEAKLLLEIIKNSKLHLYLPNVISNSEANGVFVVNSSHDDLMIEEMSIYDRWGARVFHENNFPVNDPDYGWDGTRANQVLEIGVYTYIIFTTHKNELIKLSGDITLIR